MAAEGGRIQLALALIAARADVNAAKAGSLLTALHCAVAGKGMVEVVAALLAAGAAIDAADSGGNTPLLLSAAAGFGADATLFLLASGANARVHDTQGRTALHVVAEPRRTEVVKALLSGGADINAVDGAGATPLLAMAEAGRTDAALLFLKLGADASRADRTGRTPLHAAAALGDLKLVKALLAMVPAGGVDPEAADAAGRTPEDCALEGRHTHVASVIEAAAADAAGGDDY